MLGKNLTYCYCCFDVTLAGAEYVQAAQKFITGLDARRLSKFSEYRYFSIFFLSSVGF